MFNCAAAVSFVGNEGYVQIEGGLVAVAGRFAAKADDCGFEAGGVCYGNIHIFAVNRDLASAVRLSRVRRLKELRRLLGRLVVEYDQVVVRILMASLYLDRQQ